MQLCVFLAFLIFSAAAIVTAFVLAHRSHDKEMAAYLRNCASHPLLPSDQAQIEGLAQAVQAACNDLAPRAATAPQPRPQLKLMPGLAHTEALRCCVKSLPRKPLTLSI